MNLKWTDETTKEFIYMLVEASATNGSSENGFKKQIWTWILEEFTIRTGLQASKDQLHSKMQTLKGDFSTYHALVQKSGFAAINNLNLDL